MARKVRIDMTGLRYGRLVGVAFSHTSRSGRAQWLFSCDCGSEHLADGGNVRSGGTASCGCLHREVCAARLTVHGRRAAKRHDSTYRAWQEINTYCGNSASPRYRDFGGAGLRVCAAWAGDFERFLRDMGERPADTVLVRIDAMADFQPGNCRWAGVRPRSERAVSGHRSGRVRSARSTDPDAGTATAAF